MIRTLVVWLVIASSSSSSAADLFEWSDPAPHHAAAVVVKSSTGDQGVSLGGSGVYVRLCPKLMGVLTCRHVVAVAASARVQWSDGKWSEGPVRTDRTDQDSAFIQVSHPTIQPLTIAADNPAQQSRVEYLGFGGPANHRLRPHWGTVLGYRGRDIATTAPVVSGDSGGCILNEQHQVVGLSAYGENTIALIQGEGGPWHVYRPSGGPALLSLQSFVARIEVQQCGPGGCSPGTQWAAPSRPGGGSQLYPSTPTPETPRQKPDISVVPPLETINYEAIYKKMIELMAVDPRFRGPAGADGKDGSAGPQGPPGEATAGPPGASGPAGPPPTDEQIQAAVAAWITANPEQLAKLLPPIYFRKVNAATGVEIAPPQPVFLGEGFSFLLTPEKK